MANAHSDLVNACLLRLSARGVLCWRNPTGLGITMALNVMPFGKKGSSDILGCSPLGGRFVAVEVKTGTGRQSPGQKRFQRAVELRGGLYVLARCVEDTDVVPGWDEARGAA